MMKLLTCMIALLTGCGGTSEKPVDPGVCSEARGIQERFDVRLAQVATGDWVVNDCDAMLWNAKLYSVAGAPLFHVELAEREPGRYHRRPAPCWTAEEGDIGSKTTWSRDMGRGLIMWAWRTKNVAVLQAHFDYGKAHDWIMGYPFDDGRVLYTPAIQGALGQTIYALGGADTFERKWPDVYPGGLTDYEAHLQVLSIQHRGEVEEYLRTKGEGDARPPGPVVVDDPSGETALVMDVSPDMKERLKEHAEREPGNAFFQAAYGRYSGNMEPAASALTAEPWFRPSYVRCTDLATCDAIEWLFAADIYLKACKGK